MMSEWVDEAQKCSARGIALPTLVVCQTISRFDKFLWFEFLLIGRARMWIALEISRSPASRPLHFVTMLIV
jgi:hypothetical protein